MNQQTTEIKQAKVISFINMKGGVGKTTLCTLITEHFSSMGSKVLLIDIDPQFNCTQTFYTSKEQIDWYYEQVNDENTIKKIFKTATQVTEEVEEATPESVIHSYKDNLDIILGDINIIYENHTEADQTLKLFHFINEHRLLEKYDFIFIDCPPTISLYTNAALYASDFYIIPSKLDRYSSFGTANLMNMIKYRIRTIKRTGVSRIHQSPLGIIYTDTPRKLSVEQETLKTEIETHPSLEGVYYFENNFLTSKKLAFGEQNKFTKSNINKICDEIKLRIQEISK